MAQFYAVKLIASGKIIAYVSDDAQGFASISAAFQKIGPYATQELAQQANEPLALTPQQVTINLLMSKSSALWTNQDIADFLKAKG